MSSKEISVLLLENQVDIAIKSGVQAILDERERCAKIAEEEAERKDGRYDSRTAYHIAEEIRRGF